MIIFLTAISLYSHFKAVRFAIMISDFLQSSFGNLVILAVVVLSSYQVSAVRFV